ncbi:HsdM family class I SAM-dependent methyltransferase [Proteiniphilum propionicum]|uniref:HsdM family class I SAM-dependent methyltransferase n=1 Tax=Proteiniphilum propionicum TaxID=2829812 RepID=UPI001EEA83C0|nr:N-6 DNA methylase [Proteiniphilum propionicum]ULB35443.1 N-6 DNA methylase [Proteiniphilum propionicum]
MNDFENIESWESNFGLLPIKLNPTQQVDRFLMLNGGLGDFCLKTSALGEEDIKNVFQESWSTNTKNFLFIDKDHIEVTNWYDNKTEKIPKNKIEFNINQFYKYLSSKSFKTQNDVVPFVLDIFRQLRNITFEKQDSSEAINLLFYLLISLEEDYTKVDVEKWNISTSNFPDRFEYFVELINQGVRNIKPNLDLILRHTAGALFQEAHREVIFFNPQRDLFGGVSSKLETKIDAYSSIHYTPQYIARSIVENALKSFDLNSEKITILDPSCGSSEFLIEVLKQLKNKGFNGRIVVKGFDSSDSAVRTSKFLLSYENRKQWDNIIQIDIRKVSDSLVEDWGQNDIVLMNPPFISWELLKEKESRDNVLAILENVVKKSRPNQATAFFYKATQSLKENGIIGCVLPTSIFYSEIYSELRNKLYKDLSFKVLAKLGNYVFEDALTDVSLFVASNSKSILLPKLIWTKNEKGIVQDTLREFRKMNANNEQSINNKNFSIYIPPYFPILKDSWKIISLKENDFIKELDIYHKAGKFSAISDVFTINQGALLGVKNVFKISSEEFNSIPTTEKKYFRPVVTNDSLRTGKIIISEYVWFPYDKNGLIFKEENNLTGLHFYKTRLFPNKEILEKRSGINNWWSLTRPRNWQFIQEPRLLSNRFGNSKSFGFDKKGDCVIEEGNAFIPKKEFQTTDYYFYLALFSSSIFDLLLSIYSKPIMSGYDLGKIQIKNIPIPNIHKNNLRENGAYLKLTELGKELENGNSFVKQVIDDILKSYFYPKF